MVALPYFGRSFRVLKKKYHNSPMLTCLLFYHSCEPFCLRPLDKKLNKLPLVDPGLCRLRFHSALPEIPFCFESEMFVYGFCFEMLNKTGRVSCYSLYLFFFFSPPCYSQSGSLLRTKHFPKISKEQILQIIFSGT